MKALLVYNPRKRQVRSRPFGFLMDDLEITPEFPDDFFEL